MNGQSAWHLAAWKCIGVILEKLWGWGREVQINFKGDLLLDKHANEHTAYVF